MKIPGRCGKHKMGSKGAIIAILAYVLLVALTPAFAASGGDEHASGQAGEHGGGHGAVHSPPWMVTDTAKVLNFAVLAIGLFLVLKKPVSQALGGRIQGIKEQLEDLESKKKAAEAKLPNMMLKWPTGQRSRGTAGRVREAGRRRQGQDFEGGRGRCREVERAGQQEHRI
jgi:hypothetical protein